MAEIKVERKDSNSNPIWPWIVGILLLLLIVWGLVEFFQTDEPEFRATREVVAPVEETESRPESMQMSERPSQPVNSFISFVEEGEESPEMGLHHNYTSEGIERLSLALAALADEEAPDDVEISQKKESMQQSADRIQQDPESLQHANIIKETFMEATALMESIQQHSFPDSESEVEDVRSAAEDLEVDTPTLEQEEKVKDFFRNASDALQAMNSSR